MGEMNFNRRYDYMPENMVPEWYIRDPEVAPLDAPSYLCANCPPQLRTTTDNGNHKYPDSSHLTRMLVPLRTKQPHDDPSKTKTYEANANCSVGRIIDGHSPP